jgi:hypothetical protein
MMVVNSSRDVFYGLTKAAFELHKIPRIALEIGVLRGDNANSILQDFSPTKLFLLDAYSAEEIVNAVFARQHRHSWLRSLDSLANYFGGDVRSQATFDKLQTIVEQRFSHDSRVSLARGSSSDWRSLIPLGVITFAYVDASHQFEDVFDDLLAIHQNASENCVVQLNDCSCSAAGFRQNMGVLEAVGKFIKLFDWRPILLANEDGGDLIIARGQTSTLYDSYKKLLVSSRQKFVELPPSFLSAAKVIDGGNLSF